MTPDEPTRMDQIQTSLQSIAANMDVLTRMHIDLERAHTDLERAHTSLVRQHEEFDRKTAERMGQLMDTMNRLANIVVAHEDRLDRLDGGES